MTASAPPEPTGDAIDRAGTAGVLAPPPLIFAAFLLVGLGLDRLLGLTLGVEAAWRVPLAAGCALAGLALALPAIRGFRRAGTQVEPWKPASALVVEGPYRFTRNPMYLGLALLYLGIALWAGGPLTLLLGVPFLVTLRYGVIGREERYLEARFGQRYRDYKARVRRWL